MNQTHKFYMNAKQYRITRRVNGECNTCNAQVEIKMVFFVIPISYLKIIQIQWAFLCEKKRSSITAIRKNNRGIDRKII